MQQNDHSPNGAPRTSLKLAFASLGVVFGDIGTSPLYAMREALHPVVAAGETCAPFVVSCMVTS